MVTKKDNAIFQDEPEDGVGEVCPLTQVCAWTSHMPSRIGTLDGGPSTRIKYMGKVEACSRMAEDY